MTKYRKKDSFYTIALRSRVTQLVLVIVIIFLCFQVFDQYYSAQATNERRQQALVEYQERKQEKEQLAEQVSSLEDEYHIEAEIRRNFDVAKEGEDVVIILDPPPDPEPAVTPKTQVVPWYQFWR